MLGEKFGHLGLDRLRQQGTRSVAQHLGERVSKRPRLKQLDDGSIGHGVSLLCWRSGGANTPTIRRLLPLSPSPTFGDSSLRTAGISVPYVFEGAINGQRFRAYVEQMLAPTLAPGDIVLLDNLRGHKVAGIAEAIEARGAQLIYLPPYSPDLKPIEQAFAKYKALLRNAAERTVETLWQAIGRTADLFSPAECRNFFNNAGYAT